MIAGGSSLRLEDRDGGWVLSGPGSATFVLVNEYLGYLGDRNYSPQTVRAYGFDLLAFCRWLAGEDVALAAVTTDVLLRFLSACREARVPGRPGGPNVVTLGGRRLDQYAATTINRRLAAGLNVQLACTLDGGLEWISDPVDGSRHDTHCLRESGVLLTLDPASWIGDKGYIGNGMITPIRKPAHRKLLDWEKEFNKQVNKIRYVVERAIANFKTWRIMHTDYRRPLAIFVTTISTVIALYFYAIT